jgi:glycine cleavage system H lipoate-binding protein
MASFKQVYPTPLERQFNRYYNETVHQYAHLHKNKSVTMIGLSPNHPATLEGVVKVAFSKAAASNEALGKKKRGALALRPDTLLCTIETKTGKVFNINACVNMDLVETNQRLASHPELVSQDPEGAGFLCVGLIRLETNMDRCFPGFFLGGAVMKYREEVDN